MNRRWICGPAIGLILGLSMSGAAQQSQDAQPGAGLAPMLFSPAPTSGANQPGAQVELPATFPSVPPGVAVAPPAVEGVTPTPPAPPRASPAAAAPTQAPVTVTPTPGVTPTPLPTTTPMPPADVAAPLVPFSVPATPSQGAPAAQPSRPAQPAQAATPAPPSQPSAPIGPAPTPANPAAAPPVRYPSFAGNETRQQVIRLNDMGRPDGVHLEGTMAEAAVAFSTRQDDAIVNSRISLMFSYSSAVGRDDGDLSVFLNGELLGTVALGKARGPKSRAEFTFSPALLTTDNRLQFRFALKGQGANACKVARDRAFWVRIEPTTFIYLGSTRLPLADDLSYLPRPFLDPKDSLPLTLPFVLPPGPEPGVVQAAGMVAGYFGMIAQYKGATFPVIHNGLPAGNAVVMVVGDRYPPGVLSIPGEGPRVAVVANPLQVDSKLLLVIGGNVDELRTAASTLALGTARLTGGWSQARMPLPPLREPYDAPEWISTEHPVRLGELVPVSALNGRRIADAPQVVFRTAPDLFFGALSGGTLNLRLHRANDSWINAGESRVFISLNERVVGEVPLEPKLKVLSRLKEWLLPGKADDRVSPVLLPGYQLFSSNRIQFLFDLKGNEHADCADLEWSDRTGIDPDSTINLTRVAHFAAFPNLALFANAGFPFTRLADLSDTAFVLSDAPSADEVQAMLNLIGRFADATGLPPTRYAVVTSDRVNTVADRNLIVLGLDSTHPLLRQWERFFSVHITSNGVTTAPGLTFLQRLFQPYDPRAPYYDGAAVELARAHLGKPYAYLASFWSPLATDRLVVAVGATEAASLVEMTKQMEDPELIAKVQGDFFLFTEGKGEFYTSRVRKFVGELPIWWRIQWLAGSFGLAAFGCVICAIIVFAVVIQRFSAHRAARLLAVR